MLHNEIFVGALAPTVLELDASAVMDSAVMERVTRKQRFNAARLAMLRQWAEDDTLVFEKVGSADMRSEIFSKAKLYTLLKSFASWHCTKQWTP